MTLPAHTPPGLKLAMAWEQHCVGHPLSVGHFTLVNCHWLFEPIEELVPPYFRAKFISECLPWHLVWGWDDHHNREGKTAQG